MKHFLHITTTFDKPELMENMVEQLAVKRYDHSFDHQNLPTAWKPLASSSVESYVTGTMALDFEDEQIRIPFTSSFLFSCTKEKYEPYRLCWSLSLS